MQLAPIVLFVYNRPEHTRRTIEALQRDPLAGQSELVIYSDGPKGSSDRLRVGEVREILKGITGFRKVLLRESESNRGLAASIIEGVTTVINEYGRVIVLEDDLVVAPQFLTYMNNALYFYAESERVMHISGYMYPVEQEGLAGTFFLRFPSSWGWGTWQRAWSFYEKKPADLDGKFSADEILRFNIEGAHDFWEQVRHNRQGKADTWAIFWYATIFKRNGLCLYPRQTLVKNIGHDGTGEHCLITNAFSSALSDTPVAVTDADQRENTLALKRVRAFYQANRMSKWRRVWLVPQVRLKRFFDDKS